MHITAIVFAVAFKCTLNIDLFDIWFFRRELNSNYPANIKRFCQALCCIVYYYNGYNWRSPTTECCYGDVAKTKYFNMDTMSLWTF